MIPLKGIKYNQLVPSKSGMSYNAILKKLKKGISLYDRERAAENKEIQSIARRGAGKYQFKSEFAGLGEGFMEQIQSGSMLPDELFGWSTKSILALLLIAMTIKLKKGA